MFEVFACAAFMMAAGSANYEVVGENLVVNPGFEEADVNGYPAGWSGTPEVFSRDTTTFHSGAASLKYVNDKTDRYVLSSRGIPLKPGKRYEVSVWIKTQGVKGEDSGATVCLEWYADGPKYAGGHYPSGFKGDTDWKQLVSLTSRIPDEARSISVSCYLREENTGTAWFDDLAVREVREGPLSLALLQPNYRNEFTDAGPTEARIRAFLNLADYELKPQDVLLRWRAVLEATGEEVATGEVPATEEKSLDFTIARDSFKEGAHRVTVSLLNKTTQQTLSEQSIPVTRVMGQPQRKCYIDPYNRLIVDGQPFFPLGMYWGGINPEELAIYADSPFNCLLPYGGPSQEQLDLAQSKNLKVIYTVKDYYYGMTYTPPQIKSEEDEYTLTREKVEAFRSHPAVLAWYVNDELSLDYLRQLIAHKDFVHSLDPDHPTYAVLYQVDEIRDYMPTCDVIGTDPYPIARISASRAAEYARKTRDGVQNSRPMWMVPQVFDWANYATTATPKPTDRMPTFEEMRSMAWQCIAEGARGLIFYSWFDIRRDKRTPFDQHWPKVKTMAAEIKDMIPILLSIEPAPAITCAPNPSICWRVQQLGPTTYLIVANAVEQASSAQFALPKQPQSVKVRSSGENVAGVAQTLDVALPPLDVKIFEMTGLN